MGIRDEQKKETYRKIHQAITELVKEMCIRDSLSSGYDSGYRRIADQHNNYRHADILTGSADSVSG